MGASVRNRLFWVLTVSLAACCLVASPLSAQITFEKWFGGRYDESGRSVRQTLDGGYVVAGFAPSLTPGWLQDVYLIRTDALGETLWTTMYGDSSADEGYSVCETQDGGFAIAGYTQSFGTGPGDDDVYLVRIDSVGDTVWTRPYGGADPDRGSCVQQTQDKGYIIAGSTKSYGLGSDDVYLVRTDSLGDTLWTRNYDGGDWDVGRCVQQTQDGGYIIAGISNSFGPGFDNDVYVIRTDSLGDTLWTRIYGGTGTDHGSSVQQTQDKGYIVTGETSSSGAGGTDVYLVKIDSLGDTLWTKTYGGGEWDSGRCVQQTDDGGYIVVGFTESFGKGMRDVYLIKTNSLGDSTWTRTFGGADTDDGISVRQTDDGGYILTGYTSSFGAGMDDVYLIKTDENGLVGIEERRTASGALQRSFLLFQNSPNPFHHSTLISYSLPASTEVTLAIFDITGRLVETLVNETQQPGIHQVRWDRGSNPSGVCFCRLRAGDFVETRKMVLID